MLFLGEEGLWRLGEGFTPTACSPLRTDGRVKLSDCQANPATTHRPFPLPSSPLWLSWFHLANMERGGQGVIPWPHQISPNWVRCLARVKTSNLKGIKCKCDDHMPTSNTDSSHPAALPLSPSLTHTAEPFKCLTEWGAVKMTMGFCHADQVQNISTAGRVLSCLISVNRTFATKVFNWITLSLW